MKHITLLFLLTILTNIIYAQNGETDLVSQSNISQLDFMVGKWTGNGWMIGQDRQRHEFEQTEDIKFKLDGTVLLIEGKGTSNGTVIHHALAIVTWNKENDQYHFRSYLVNGRKGEYKAELIDGKFYWYPMDNMRYIIEINEQGQWYEKGEYNNQGNWSQFFEMTLKKE